MKENDLDEELDSLSNNDDLVLSSNHLQGKFKSLLHLLDEKVKSLAPDTWVEGMISSNPSNESEESDEDFDECCMLLLEESNDDEVLHILEPYDIERELLSGEYFTNGKLPESDLSVCDLDISLEYYPLSWDSFPTDSAEEDYSTELPDASNEVKNSQCFYEEYSYLNDFFWQVKGLEEFSNNAEILAQDNSFDSKSSPDLNEMKVVQVGEAKQTQNNKRKRSKQGLNNKIKKK